MYVYMCVGMNTCMNVNNFHLSNFGRYECIACMYILVNTCMYVYTYVNTCMYVCMYIPPTFPLAAGPSTYEYMHVCTY
jgi:hypothetical protein